MDINICCMTWVPILWGRILRLFTQARVVDLPEDIVMDIFSRLPAELVFRCRHPGGILEVLTSSQSFIELHLSRTTSTIVVPGYLQACRLPNNICKGEVPLHFIDDRTKKVVPRSMRISYHYQCSSDCFILNLFYSYKGLLLFRNGSVFIIWNPVTEEQVIVSIPFLSCACGFFFDPKAKEFKVLLMQNVDPRFQFIIYGLGSRSSRMTSKFCHPPWSVPPVVSNGALHWMVHEERYEQAMCSSLKSSESILLFDMETENVSTMARPGGKYARRIEVAEVHLLNMEGQLCYCEVPDYVSINLWLLENYTEKVWIKKHTISLEFLGCPFDVGSRPSYYVNFLKLDKDELLLKWTQFIYRYNVKLHVSRKIDLRRIYTIASLYAFVVHTDSLVSLGTDSHHVVSFQSCSAAN